MASYTQKSNKYFNDCCKCNDHRDNCCKCNNHCDDHCDNRCKCCVGPKGATGPQGPAGAQGPAGPRGPAGPNVVADHADIYRVTNTTALSQGNTIPFDASFINSTSGAITFTNGNSTINLGANMTFFVRFTATSETGIPYAIGLRLNGLRINGSIASAQVADTSISNGAIFRTGANGGQLDLFVFFANQTISLIGFETSLQIIRLA